MTYASSAPRSGGGQPVNRRKPNWLFRCLIIGSIGLHTVLLFHIAGIYRSQAMTVIELSLKNESVPQREIPRPRPRPRNLPQQPDKIMPIIPRTAPPAMKPIQMASLQADLPGGIAESISDVAGVQGSPSQIEGYAPINVPKFSLENFDSPNSYLEMVRFRIEKYKRYPEKARQANMRGRVIISLVITLAGEVTSLAVKSSSGYDMLDEAALAAVQRAVPFPAPPERFFKKDLMLNIPILFEIT